MKHPINFAKLNGLVPAIIQEPTGGKVLMTGFMNEEALAKTIQSGKVTFYSRTRKTLWVKGETSGNFLHVTKIVQDCDNDAILIYATPAGPVCHTGTNTCFGDDSGPALSFLAQLQQTIHGRKLKSPESSYTARLFKQGKGRIAQKLGEEAVECVIESMKGDKDKFLEEAADLVFHLLVLLAEEELQISDVIRKLEARHK